MRLNSWDMNYMNTIIKTNNMKNILTIIAITIVSFANAQTKIVDEPIVKYNTKAEMQAHVGAFVVSQGMYDLSWKKSNATLLFWAKEVGPNKVALIEMVLLANADGTFSVDLEAWGYDDSVSHIYNKEDKVKYLIRKYK